MEIDVSEQKDFTIIKFNKHSIFGTEGVEFQKSVLNSLNKGIHSIVIDLSKVEYITSWGIGILVHAFTTTIKRDSKYSLVGVSKQVREILSKVKLDHIFHITELS